MTDWLESIAADIRFALRTLRRAPAFTAIAALTTCTRRRRNHRDLQLWSTAFCFGPFPTRMPSSSCE